MKGYEYQSDFAKKYVEADAPVESRNGVIAALAPPNKGMDPAGPRPAAHFQGVRRADSSKSR